MIDGLVARVRSLWRGALRTREVDADVTEEMRTHMEMRAADLVRSGLVSRGGRAARPRGVRSRRVPR
jgi:hypothetical protein